MKEISIQETREEGLHLIYGKAGAGKTYLANFMAQDGLTAVVTFDKSHSPLLSAMRAGRVKVFELDRYTDFKEIAFQSTLNTLKANLSAFKYVIFDNISALEQQVLSKPKKTMDINDGRQAYQLFQAEMFALCELCIELPAICLVTAWEREGSGAFGATIAQPALNNKVLEAFSGFAQSVLWITKRNGQRVIISDPMTEDAFVKNRKNTIPQFPSNMIVKFFQTN